MRVPPHGCISDILCAKYIQLTVKSHLGLRYCTLNRENKCCKGPYVSVPLEAFLT